MNKTISIKKILPIILIALFYLFPGTVIHGQDRDFMHPSFSLLDGNGNTITPDTPANIEKVSAFRTCGQCHDTAYIESHTSHNAATLQADCFTCHLKESKISSSPTYLDIQLPTPRNCAQCHGIVHTGSQPLVLPDDYTGRTHYQPGKNYYNITLHSGAVLSQQDLSNSALNLQDKENLDFAWDIHSRRQLDCIACHTTRNNPRSGGLIESPKDHLIRDPRRIKAPHQYLKRPDHRLSSAKCSSCHNAHNVHQNMPYETRHMEVLDCQSCHIPRLYGPALKAVDSTVVTLAGKPAFQFRGIEAENNGQNDSAMNTQYIKGWQPFLLPRMNNKKSYTISPFNLVTRWHWQSAANGKIVPVETLKKIYLSDDNKYNQDILGLFDTNHDGKLDSAELVLDNDAKQQLIKEKLRSVGIEEPVISSTIDAYKINHGVMKVKLMKRDCASCHTRGARFGSVISLSETVPGGVMPHVSITDFPLLTGKINLTQKGSLEIQPDALPGKYYIFGQSRISSIDRAGFIIFLLSLLFVILHGLSRFIAHRKKPAVHTPMKEVYMYRFYERLWHWTMAFAVMLLALTGFEIHYTGSINIFGLETAVRLHNVLALILVANSMLSLFYHLITGEIKQFFRFHRKFIHETLVQVFYYIYGIFKHQPHPINKSRERKLNPLQQLTYILLLNVLLPFQVITGIFIWAIGHWPQLSAKVGGIAYLAPIHHLAAWLFLAFLVIHIYLTSTGHTVSSNVRAMVTGYDEIPRDETLEEHRKEHMMLMDMRILDLAGTLIGKLPGKLPGKLSGKMIRKANKKNGETNE